MEDWLTIVLAVHAGATLLMTGLDWFVQLVHYPMFARAAQAGDEHWRAFEREHLRRTAPLIPPLMLVELAAAVWIALGPMRSGGGAERTVDPVLAWSGLGLLAVVWLATFAGAVPMHSRLERGFDARAHRLLLRFDRVRLAAWSARSVIALMMLVEI